MRRTTVLMTVLALVLFAAAPAGAVEAGERIARAELSGRNEVPPVQTGATGQARFNLSEESIEYRLFVHNIENVTQAHIHLGSADENGPVVAFLFGFVDGGVTVDGLLATGTITADDLIGPFEGEPLSALIEAIQSGNAYVNVHTVANPPGEIRGQIR